MKVPSTILMILSGLALSGCATGKTASVPSRVTVDETKIATGKQIVKAFDGGILPATSFKKLGNRDRTRALLAEYRALENGKTGQQVAWQTPNGKSFGAVIPSQPYQVGTQNCRHYSHQATIKGELIEASGAACRSPNGMWVPLR